MIEDKSKLGIFNILNDEEEIESDVKKLVGDFETATWIEDETWVWAWATCDIENNETIIGNDIESFMEYVKSEKNCVVYFHNLKFDGEFILNYLLKNEFKHVKNKEEIEDNTFTTLISDMGQFYNITVYFKKGNKTVHKVTFYDSLKILPFSVEQIAKSFNLEINKLEIDYLKEREKGHVLTKEEREYITNDVLIVAKALKVLFDENLKRMTQGSNALHDYKTILSERKFSHYYPSLDKKLDEEIRKSYKGGFTYLSKEYKEKNVGKGTILDVNSLYPSVMYYEKFPIGNPIYFEGKYKEDKVYNLYIQTIICRFKIKKDKIPCIQIKNRRFDFRENEYLESSNDELVVLTLTNIDLKLFLEQYETEDLEYIHGWKFKSIKGLFKDYIDKWIEVKNKATLEGNYGMRTLAKLMLNSLYGKFSTSLEAAQKVPFLGEDGIVHYNITEKEEKKGLYIPVGSFITSYARNKTIRTAQSIMDYSIKNYGKNLFVYSDTDSLHVLLPKEELEKFCEIDEIKLGAWKCEGNFTKARFVRQKCYIEEIDEKLHITCAGMPKQCYDYVNWKNFKTGFTCGGKLTFKHVKGGIILKETEYSIKEEKVLKNMKNFDKGGKNG